MSSEPRREPLIDHLEALAAREDRASLARLRASANPARVLEGLPIVLPFVGSDRPRRAEDDALLVASLFAVHPESGPASLPMALRTIAEASDSVELRFRALLGVARQDLDTHLRHAVSLVAGHGIPLDWRDLYDVIRFWDHPSNRAKREWARAFWTPRTSDIATGPDERTPHEA